MVITIVCDVLGQENNGTTIAAMNLVRSLKKRGHTVRVVCADEERRGQEGFYIMPTMNLGSFLNAYLAKNGVSLAKTDKEVLREALTGADEAHIMIPFALGRAALRMAKKMGLPVTAGFHCQAENFSTHIFMMNAKLVNRLIYKNFYHSFYRHVDCIHYPTEFIRSTFQGVVKKELPSRVISNGVMSMFKPQKSEKPAEYKDKFVILFTGRYSKEKSHRILIEAANMSKYRDRIQLIFAGDGPQKEKIIECSSVLPNKPVLGFYSRDELLKIINYSDLYVHPSEVEIEAIACLEAISCGLVPVINNSPRCATKYFARDDKNLFKFNDAQDLANKIDWWIDHPEEKRKASESYVGYAKRFDFEYCMDEMERMIADTVEAKKHADMKQRAAEDIGITEANEDNELRLAESEGRNG